MIAVLAFATVLAQAAQAPDAPTASCSFDTAAHLRADTVLVGLAPGPNIGNTRREDAAYRDAAEVIREFFRAPTQIGLPLWARLTSDSMRGADTTEDPLHGFDGDVQFSLDQGGRVRADKIAVETFASDLAESVVSAIRRADSSAAFAPLLPALQREMGTIRLHFATPRPGSAPFPMLLRVIVPVIRLDRDVHLETTRPIRYPDNARLAGITGRVVPEFVVGVDGRAIEKSLRILHGENRELVSAVIEAIPGMRFRPARIDSCDVPALIRAPVDFSIRR